MKILRFHVTIFVLLLVPLPYQNVECKFQLLTEWSRRFFDFVRATPLARKFLSGGEPVTTVSFKYYFSKNLITNNMIFSTSPIIIRLP